MEKIKVTSWNIEHFSRIFDTPQTNAKAKRRIAIAQEIREINPDILCLIEGPKNAARLKSFTENDLGSDYVLVEADDGNYATRGDQFIWFLVRNYLRNQTSLLPVDVWKSFTRETWPVHYWGVYADEEHSHYRHPQTLILDWYGLRVEFIGLHLKSKYINEGKDKWETPGKTHNEFIFESLKARVKLATEAENVRRYLDAKFNQVDKPAVFVLGDLNDGPGKDFFENQYLFFDLVSTLQGDIFFARKFLNHALFDYPQELRWSARFDDFVEGVNDRPILIDHILFTQGLVNDVLPLTVKPHAGWVEHEIHELINASLSSAAKTSDHHPVSVNVSIL